MSKASIQASQQVLQQVGFYTGAIDGMWGKNSHKAVLKAVANDGYQPAHTQDRQHKPYNTVVITAGHGGRDSGAVNGHITESHIATEMRNMITHYLRQKGVTVINDGDGHTNLPLKKAVRLIKEGDIAIEIHTNAAFSNRAKGVEALAQPKDKAVCQALCQAVAKVLDTSVRGDKGYKPENAGQHSRLAYVSRGGIILELFFISNPKELKKYQQRKWLVAKAIADVLSS